MFNCKQFRASIIQPSLNKIKLYCADAEELLVATCAQESEGGTFLVQMGSNSIPCYNGGLFYNGGLGIFQMEQATHDSLWANKLKLNSALGQLILDGCGFSKIPSAIEMVTNLQYATMMARVFYTQFPESLPPSNDINAIWIEYKAHWNTWLGAATKDEFISNYHNFYLS